MRSLIAATLALGLTVSVTKSRVLRAQRAPISVGVLAGANLSSVNVADAGLAVGEDLLRNQRRGGAQAALYATVPVAGRLSLQPELHYVQKGGRGSLALPIDPEQLALYADDEVRVGLRLSYLEMPVLARVDMGGAGRWRPFVLAGPSFALRVGCRVSANIGPFGVSGACDDNSLLPDEPLPTEPTDAGDPVRTTDIGAVGGIGVEGALAGRVFSVQVRYTQGLRSIASENIPGLAPKNRGVALVLGLGF
ncbi:porin family protein [Gemmatimonas sp.]